MQKVLLDLMMLVNDNRQSHTHRGSESRNFSVRRVAFNEKEIMLDGHNLDIKSVVAVARYCCSSDSVSIHSQKGIGLGPWYNLMPR